MTEGQYQSKLRKRIEEMFPGCMIFLTHTALAQGYPDLLILYNDRWAALEVKMSSKSVRQPNQDYFVDRFNEMSFASYIYPENEEEVLSALQQAFGSPGRARIS
jgi:hypothetical protein